jgi:hypothetical protein
VRGACPRGITPGAGGRELAVVGGPVAGLTTTRMPIDRIPMGCGIGVIALMASVARPLTPPEDPPWLPD